MRKTSPWIGTTDDAKIPLHVQLRILEKQGGRCAITGHKFKPGDKKHLDHKFLSPMAAGMRRAIFAGLSLASTKPRHPTKRRCAPR